MPVEHLRFAPQILRRLGEELVPHADLGILELVRNAYDADATRCTVSLGVDNDETSISIEDDGNGMSYDDIRSGWLLLGKSSKTDQRFTPNGRRKVGEKGLGRLAAVRLGRKVEVITRQASEPSAPEQGKYSQPEVVENSLTIDWRAFDSVETVGEVPIAVTTRDTNLPPGTLITVSGMPHPLAERDVRRLARSLVLLTGPFPARNTFRAVLRAPQYAELERLVREAYFDEHEYLLVAAVDSEGRATAELADWSGRVVARSDQSSSMARKVYECPPTRFELWVFNLSKSSFDVRQSQQTVAAVQAWLREVGGVHLFQRGLRVHPYGDPGHDWLDMNLRRARSPELRPSTNTSIGRMTVTDDEDRLVPKTDRTGFIENNTFSDLRQFGQDALDWAAEERLRLRESQRATERKTNEKAVKDAHSKVSESLDGVPADVRPKVQRAIDQYEAAFNRQLKSTEDDLLLYRTLSTVGTVTAVFAHETLRPVATIQQMASSLKVRIGRIISDDEYEKTFAGPIDRIVASSLSLRSFAELPLHMLSRAKRRRRQVDVAKVAEGVMRTFAPYVLDNEVDLSISTDGVGHLVTGTEASVEAIFANMIANSVFFLSRVPSIVSRRIEISVEAEDGKIVVTVADTGTGLVDISPSDVWLPGKSTREDGTGLGLTIVRDAVREMGGSVTALSSGRLGGAEFRIVLPRSEKSTDPSLLDTQDPGVAR